MSAHLDVHPHKILQLLADCAASGAIPPSVREIGEHIGALSTSTPSHHLAALEEDGLIERIPGASRGVRITAAGLKAIGRKVEEGGLKSAIRRAVLEGYDMPQYVLEQVPEEVA